MSDAANLSGDEVSALMDGLGEADAAAGKPSAELRAYTFGKEAVRPMAALPALDRMNERLERRLRGIVEPLARSKPRIHAEAIAVQSFDGWRAEHPEFISLSLYRFAPLKGGVLVAMGADLVGRLVDAFYGGTGALRDSRAKEFTPTEERLIVRINEGLVAALTEVWNEILPVKPQLVARETNTAYAPLVRGDEAVAIVRFGIALGGARPASIDILYPVAALRAVEGLLSNKASDDGSLAASEWRHKLADALGDVRVQARSVLARPEISVSELVRLAEGDVIPVSLPASVPLLVEGRVIARGQIGDQDGRAALRIEKLHTGGNI
ncbi:flagellar motor switch protein FliM [Allosphingosinicella indica]|uniref:Flagellar motor switch protein FliM n=1 Tax=Allosphingosinicella indica TaxID=941907 RepID=A0A1X7GPF6_9SPHN|nr:FliM/FliN family flagellar motor switch protein [Allosphingosinicella indica]SMF72635.1 flagellar motor switch protein FliM [Allosphingosinicella indica]